MVTTEHGEAFELTPNYWGAVVVSGLLAGVLMGVLMHQVMGIMQAVGALYTLETTSSGWVFHLIHATVFAVVFGGFFMWDRLAALHDRVLPSAALGIAWGVALWLVAAGVVMPLWLAAVGAPSPGVPTWDPWSGIGHVLYGTVLGGGSAMAHRYLSPG